MDRFRIHHIDYALVGWKLGLSDGRHAYFHEVRDEADEHDKMQAIRAHWRLLVIPLDGPGMTSIEAFELPDGKGVRLDFTDGRVPGYRLYAPIGQAFLDFIDSLVREMRQAIEVSGLEGY